MTYLIAHLSDPHIGPLPRMPLHALLNKRLTGALNWHSSRSTIHNMAVLDRLIADIAAQVPDHVALTGDLVNLGHPAEFPLALRQLEPLGGPEAVSIIPGNHDAYIGESLPAMARQFYPFMLGDGDNDGIGTGLPPFPYLRKRGKIALIGVNTGVPTLPFMATGKVGAEQMVRLADLLEKTRTEGLIRIIMIHHPPMQQGAKLARGLSDAAAFEAMIRRHGAELILHGHNHIFQHRVLEGPKGRIPVLGAGSASAVPGTPHHLAEYTLIRIDLQNSAAMAFARRGIRKNAQDPVGEIAAGTLV